MHPLPALLRDHRFPELFRELGWEQLRETHQVRAGGREWKLDAVAHKRSLPVFRCRSERIALINRRLLRDLQRAVKSVAHEHILIVTCEEPRKQVWLWSVHLPDGGKLRHCEHPFFSAMPPVPLIDRLERLAFTLDEEETVGLADAIDRVRLALDAPAELNLFVRKPKYAERSDRLAVAMRAGDENARC